MITKTHYKRLLPKLRKLRSKGFVVRCECKHINGIVIAVPASGEHGIEGVVYVMRDGVINLTATDDKILGLSHKAFDNYSDFNSAFFVEFKKNVLDIDIKKIGSI